MPHRQHLGRKYQRAKDSVNREKASHRIRKSKAKRLAKAAAKAK